MLYRKKVKKVKSEKVLFAVGQLLKPILTTYLAEKKAFSNGKLQLFHFFTFSLFHLKLT
jgi:hypothetical protein